MAWYWWIIAAILLTGLVGFKVWYVPKWLKKQQDKKRAREKLLEDDEE